MLAYTEKAKSHYLQSGRLSSIASMLRSLGTIYGKLGNKKQELNSLLTWHHLTEILREQILADEVGLNRAGYAKNKEQIIELLINAKRDTEALAILESAKGSLQDVLLNERETMFPAFTVEEVIKTLPKYWANRVFCLSVHTVITMSKIRSVVIWVLKSQSGDAFFTAYELFSLPMKKDLIVLSACYSGLSDKSPMPGDDLFGIQRMLLQGQRGGWL
ncbi:MAG: CHAT domain-containing protein [Planctomycetaceae bacterium]|nr:CHAT domain-containing protein [Planctomycetaceae bacterium]